MTSKITRRVAAFVCGAFALSACSGVDGSGTPAADTASAVSPGPDRPEMSPLVQQRWWAWAAAEPTATNPVADPDGGDCARNQPGDVWFVAGTFGGRAERRCAVPAGRPIIAPLVNLVSDDPADCEGFLDEADGWAVLDMQRVTPARMASEPVRFEVVAGSPLFGSDGGTFDGVACGLWVALEPPDPGEHQLVLRGLAGDLNVWVEYTLDVRS
ncbi:hypothetical protein [Micromonospora palythoicola]|uniref:hypothetical protein n=1 Tax=Micromonospora palythoicola TaxID=3120507 RepID=UPI002FCE2F0C